MGEQPTTWAILRRLTWHDVAMALTVLVLARILIFAVRRALRHAAEVAPARLRLTLLRLSPIARLGIESASLGIVVSILMEPSFQNVAAVFLGGAFALAFAFKDYGSCLVAGLVTILENTYQPGDWIELDGTYGEVKAIGTRAVHLVTPDDTEVIIPHSRLWSSSVFNATSGNRSLLCVAEFHLHADHDAGIVRQRLTECAQASVHRKAETSVVVVAMEKPWGTKYKVKAYARESREQFLLITDLTVRGKEALRALQVRFAQAAYVETGKGS
ncbi:MAG: mechanosensitive ion channel [Planctomycetes bacterium]|nr:mechanosensitive ion channel [Planctomycetota bacterium]